MSIEKGIPQFDKERIYTDTIIRSNEGRDMMAALNSQFEMIEDVAAPGSSIRNYRGHTHDSKGSGRGILRVVNGGCYVVDSVNYGPPRMFTKSTLGWQNIANASAYYASTPGGEEIIGVAYVSPGIDSIRVACCFGCSTLIATPQFRIRNLTDSKNGGIMELTTTDPRWYDSGTDVEVTRNVLNRGDVRRIEIAIQIDIGAATSTRFDLYHAFPYEYEDADA